MRRCAFLALLAILCLGAFAAPALADKRVALVIGNSAYQSAPRLPNPINDAQDVAASLQRSGFETIVGVDLDKAGMDEAAIKFARAARNADVAVFYYSGHAIQFAGSNYLIPIDAKLADEADLRRMTKVDDIVADLQPAKALRILVLDACRNNPMAEQMQRAIGRQRALSIQRGLAKIDSPEGMIVAYATQAGSTADDGRGRNSPYTAAFLKHIEEPEEIGTIFRRVAADVYETTGRVQIPELSISLVGEFYLQGRLDIAVHAQPPVSDPCAAASDHWKSAETIGTMAAFEDHVARFPNCSFVGLAKARIESLKDKVATHAPPVLPALPSQGVRPPYGRLGVRIHQVTEDIAAEKKLKSVRGALVTDIDDTGAAKPAGIQIGDVIIGMDGKDITDMSDLPRIVLGMPAGKSVEVVVIREGDERRFRLTLGRLEDRTQQQTMPRNPACAKIKGLNEQVQKLKARREAVAIGKRAGWCPLQKQQINYINEMIRIFESDAERCGVRDSVVETLKTSNEKLRGSTSVACGN